MNSSVFKDCSPFYMIARKILARITNTSPKALFNCLSVEKNRNIKFDLINLIKFEK